MDLGHLLRPDAPWVHVLVANASETFDAARALEAGNACRVAVRVLRGRKMQTATALFDEFAAALQFPPYFGGNWDALDECLTDLEWLPANAYVLVILEAAHVLEQDRNEERQVFWEMLGRVAREWGQPVSGSVPRPAKAFRVLLQCLPEEEDRVRAQLPAAVAAERD